jgi:hypothetical protein
VPIRRTGLMLLFVLALATSPFLAQAVGASAGGSLGGARELLVAAGKRHPDNGGNDNEKKDENDSNDNGNNSNDNGDNNNHDNGNGDDGQGQGGAVQGNGPVLTSGGGSGGCIQAGSDRSVSSSDGRITVHVFPSMSRSVRLTIVTPVDPASVPSAPGPKVDALLFQLNADDCAGAAIATLPAEVNLGVRYSDQDAGGLTESKFTLTRLDPASNSWKPLEKQAADPNANLVSATTTATGTYLVYQAP